MDNSFAVAVVGTGPRGVSLIERLVTMMGRDRPRGPVTIYAVDAVEVGCGRVWRTDQPSWLLMDNSADELTIFSGPADTGPARAGHGPALDAWAREHAAEEPTVRVGRISYLPRRAYGAYLRWAFEAVCANLPENVTIVPVRDEVVGVSRDRPGRFRLRCGRGAEITGVDKLVLATGHPDRPAPAADPGAGFPAAARERFLPGRPAADVALDRVPAGASVGVLGMGLSFLDTLVGLTLGRGGTFVPAGDGALAYVAGGREPGRIVVGSRTSVPIRVRAVEQHPRGYLYAPRVFTSERVRGMRECGPLDFTRDVLPWIDLEVNLVHFETLIRAMSGEGAGRDFADRLVRHADAAQADPLKALESSLAGTPYDLGDKLDVDRYTDPFADEVFEDPAAFRRCFREVVRADLDHALAGNVDDPVKAGLEVLRFTRAVQREAVDFGGLTAGSHRDFVTGGAQPLSFLAAGTPLVRSQQLLALMDAGVLEVVGPRVHHEWLPDEERWLMTSPRVPGSGVPVDWMVDARIPKPNLHRDGSALTRQLVADGVWTSFVNRAEGTFDTGGVAVSTDAFHPLDREGVADPDVYVLGLPTEHVRWFMQVGVIPPGRVLQGLGADSQTVASDILTGTAG